jgi:hypothetical protein
LPISARAIGELMLILPCLMSASSSPTMMKVCSSSLSSFEHVDGGAEYDLTGARQLGHVDDLGIGQLGLDVFDAPLDKALLLARGVILGVLLQIAMGARLGDGLDDPRALDFLQMLQLGAQLLSASGCQRYLGHLRNPLLGDGRGDALPRG